MLIDVEKLRSHLADPTWIVFDCRHDLADPQKGLRVYEEGHIPGAFFAPVDTVLSGAKTGFNGRHPLPSPESFAEFLNACGVTAGTRLVAYDDVGGQYAARFWWLARWIGLTKVAVLDGGWPKWLAAKFETTPEQPTVRSKGNVIPKPDMMQVATSAELMDRLKTHEGRVVDARAAERFEGKTEPIDKVAGHIPSAINRFFKLNLNPDLTLRAPEDLRREFTVLLGATRPELVVHQCGSGITACANLLAMERAGLVGSRLYVGSWSEWISDPTRPRATGPA